MRNINEKEGTLLLLNNVMGYGLYDPTYVKFKHIKLMLVFRTLFTCMDKLTVMGVRMFYMVTQLYSPCKNLLAYRFMIYMQCTVCRLYIKYQKPSWLAFIGHVFD